MDTQLWYFYIIKNNNFTYAGVSPYPERRLRQHNGEISGGAKYTLAGSNYTAECASACACAGADSECANWDCANSDSECAN